MTMNRFSTLGVLIVALSTACSAAPHQSSKSEASGCREVETAELAVDIAIAHLQIDRAKTYVDGTAVRKRDKWIVFVDFALAAPGNHTQLWIDFCGKVTDVFPGA